MKLHYYPDTDSLYIEFRAGPGVRTREVSDGLNVDLDADGNVVGFDIDHTSRQLDSPHWRARHCPYKPLESADHGPGQPEFRTA